MQESVHAVKRCSWQLSGVYNKTVLWFSSHGIGCYAVVGYSPRTTDLFFFFSFLNSLKCMTEENKWAKKIEISLSVLCVFIYLFIGKSLVFTYTN